MLSINELFPDQITVINNSLMPPHFIGDVGSIRLTQNCVKQVLDQIGEMSAQEQKLNRIITSAEKLRTADGHTLYLMKDADANSGAGEAVGMLKVGKKHLFVYDEGQTVHEVEPLCVLDFYVKDTHQRIGLGKKLFDFMLQHQKMSAEKLAVDGPSVNMRSFMAKNYHLTRLIKQPNNFAVSPQFFLDLPTTTRTWTRQKNILSDDTDLGQRTQRPGDLPFVAGSPAGRFTARHPPSTMSEVLHGNVSFNQDGEKYQRSSSGRPTPAPSPSPLDASERAAAGLVNGGGGAGDPQRPSSLAVGPASPGTSSRRNSQLSDKGYFDVKFHHNKLW